jgi:GNAT superfamily N-acetyltransferase
MVELRTGWEPETPEDDLLLRQAVLNFTDFNVGLSGVLGARLRRSDYLEMADLGQPSGFMNNATFIRPPVHEQLPFLLDEIDAFFDAGGSGPVDVWSAWPTPDFTARGWELGGHPPLMLRSPGGATPKTLPELEIRKAQDLDAVHEFERVLATSFGAADAPSVFDDRVLDLNDIYLWVGYVDGVAVSTSATCVTRDVNGVQCIATLPEYRGRGYGEAMTWPATVADPTAPAVLLASDLGRPVYERMGYVALLRYTYWRIPRP